MKTYTKEELQEIIRKHDLWLSGKEGGERANLSGSNLSGSDLSGSNLRYSNLSDSNLRYSNLSDSNLSYSNLSDSNLSNSNLSGSNLSGSVGNNREVKTLQLGNYWSVFWSDRIAIGCQNHTVEQWRNFTDSDILEMDGKSGLLWWRKWKDTILELAEEMPKQ